ncbi:unnamed protein product, partial [Rotaria sordida]
MNLNRCALGQQVVPMIHDMSQLDAIFIFCGNAPQHEQWAKEWAKIKVVSTTINEALSFHEKAVEIRGKTRPPCHPDLAESYYNIGLVHNSL